MSAETQYHTTPDGAKIAYSVLGADKPGAPIILIMGLSGVKEDWGDLASALAKSRPVCVLDNRGIGQSTLSPPLPPFPSPPALTITQMAIDTFSILEHLNWRKVLIFGMSMGGMIAQQLAVLLNGRDDFKCIGLILLCTTPKAQLRGFMAELYAKMADKTKLSKEDKMAIQASLWEYNLTPSYVRSNPTKMNALMIQSAQYRRPMAITVQQLEAISTFDITAQLQQVNIPTLVIHGTDDRIIRADFGEAIAEMMPNAKMVLLEGIGHMTYIMDEGKTHHAVEEFLGELEGCRAKL